MNLPQITSALKKLSLDAYFLYDFHNSNPLLRELIGFAGSTSRRFVVIFASDGTAHLVVSRMEQSHFAHLNEFVVHPFTTYGEFEAALKQALLPFKRVAIDYSENSELPVLDLIPHGIRTILSKVAPSCEFVSARDLSTEILGKWGKPGYASHKLAAEQIKSIFDKTVEMIRTHLGNKKPLSDYEVMIEVLNRLATNNLSNDYKLCIVATRERSADPHYYPTAQKPAPIEANSALILDIWGKHPGLESIYADMTLLGWIGPEPIPAAFKKAWDCNRGARDAALEFIDKKVKQGVRGYEVDKLIRERFEKAGYGSYILHRTGHSLGKLTHANAANLDDFETKDTRLISADCGYTIEPGIYLPEFGVRGEIDFYIHNDMHLEVTTWKQEEIVVI